MENIPVGTKKVIKISRKALIIIVIILVIGFLLFKNNRYDYPVMFNTGAKLESTNGVSFPSMPYPYPDQYGDSSVKDTREFMKVTYGAEIKTRDVRDVMRDVKSTIDGAEGRIDNLSETNKYAYISFVIPKSNLSDFKDEIESLTHEKLYTENSSSQNLLGQKQSIEEQQKTAAEYLASLQKEQKDLTAQHTARANSLQKEITSTQNQLVAVRTAISNTSDSNELATLRNQEYNLSQQEISLRQNLNSENTNYANSNQNLKNQIINANAQIESLKKQDVQFADNIETVNGYISVNWVSLWDMAKLLSPIHPAIIIVVLALLAWYYLSRKNYLPSIEFV